MDDRPIEDMTDEEVDAYLKARGFTEEKMAMANLKVLRAVNARLRNELADLRARLAAMTAERDRLREFVTNVRDMPGICTCEFLSQASREIGLRCLHCKAKSALAAPADAGKEVAGG